MSVRNVIAAATLPAMMASPVVAAGDNPAASLSLRGESSRSAADEANQDAQVPIPPIEAAQSAGISSYVLIGGAVVALVVIGAVVLGSSHHNSTPASA